MNKGQDKQQINDYRNTVIEQYKIARHTKNNIEVQKADTMYNKLMRMSHEYFTTYGERINIII